MNITKNSSTYVDYLDYYPKNIPQCEETWAPKELKLISKLNKFVKGKVEGNYCYKHGTVLEEKTEPIKERSWKRQYLREAVKGCKQGLEIGFNAGHSAAIILMANDQMTLNTIDICRYKYTLSTAKFMHKYWKGRFGFYAGSSQAVIKKYEFLKLDFIHVDGGHGIADFFFDIDFCERSLKPGGKVVIDDAYLPDYIKYIGYKLQQKVFTIPEGIRRSSGENLLLEKL